MATLRTKLPENSNVFSSALASAQLGEKPTYAGTFENQLNDIYGKIANREKFNYDVNADPLYQSYKDNYLNQGKLAMKDTMGQAAALTGGYGNTYGQQVGQQAYNAYLQNLSAVIPELYGMAYNQYKDEGDQLNNLYALAGQQRDLEYGRYRDELADWENQRRLGLENERYEREWEREAEQESYNRQQSEEAIKRALEQQEYERRMQQEAIARQLEQQQYERRMTDEEIAREQEKENYNRAQYADEIFRKKEQQMYERRMAEEQIAREQEQREYNRKIAEEQTAYNREQDAYKNKQTEEETAYKKQQQAYSNLYALIKSTGYIPNAQELMEAGMTEAAADALREEWQRGIAASTAVSSSGGSSGGSGGRSSSGSGGYSSGGYSSYGGYEEPDYNFEDVYNTWEEAIRMAQQDGADAWDINTIIQQDNDLSVQQKRDLMVGGVDSVNWDKVGDNGRLEYVNHNDEDNVLMNQVVPDNTAYDNVMKNISSTDEILAKIRNKR